MYQLLIESKTSIQTYALSGTIGDVEFTGENVIRGSFGITNQCCDTSDFGLGGVYIGELKATFTGLDIDRNDWIGLEIIPTVTINGTAEVPVGVFIINSADHNSGLTTVKAYDRMSLFDKSVSENTSATSDSAYNILSWICDQCDVSLGMSQADVAALPNGSRNYFISASGDVETYRDILFWLSQTLGGFATMNRDGELIIVSYHSAIDDTIAANIRYRSSKYGDEVITYSAFYVTNDETGIAEYYNSTPDNGYTASLGSNIFFQTGLKNDYIDGVLEALGNIEYNSCEVEIPFGIHYDLGDVLAFPNGSGYAANQFCVMYYSWTFGGSYKIKSIPVPQVAKSKSDKNITNLMRQTEGDKIQYYLITNTSDITVADGENKTIIDMRFQATKHTIAVFHAEILLTAETTVSGITYNDAVGLITYFWHDSELIDYKPVETWVDGKHILHLLYYFNIQNAEMNHFEVKLNMSGGSVVIKTAELRGSIYGQNLYATDNFDGIIRIEEDLSGVSATIGSVSGVAQFTEALTSGTKSYIADAFSDNLNITVSIGGITVTGSTSDSMEVQTE